MATNTVVWAADVVQLGSRLAECEPAEVLPDGAHFRVQRRALGIPIYTASAATGIGINTLRRFEEGCTGQPRAAARSMRFRRLVTLFEELTR